MKFTLLFLSLILCLTTSSSPTQAFLPSSPTDTQWRDDDDQIKLDNPHLKQPIDRCLLTQPIPLHMNISAVNITWSYDGPPGAQFIVQAKIGGQPCCSNITQPLSISYYIYNKLLLSQFYQFQVLAIVEGVVCNTSTLSLVFIQGASAPPGPPTSLAANVLSSSSIKLSWMAPQPPLGLSYNYHIYASTQISGLDNVNNQVEVLSDSTVYTVIGLHSNTRYYFGVVAYNGDQRTIMSSIVNATTKPEVLYPVTLNVTSISSDTIQLSWSPPLAINVDYFYILFGISALLPSSPLVNTSLFSVLCFSGNHLSANISHLEQGQTYSFAIQYSVKGYDNKSILSNLVEVTTRSTLKCDDCFSQSKSELKIGWSIYNSNNINRTYEVSLTAVSSSSSMITYVVRSSFSAVRYIASNLSTWTSYHVQVVERDSHGLRTQSSLCPFTRCRTSEDVPSAPPSSLLLDSYTAQSVTVSWKPPPSSKQNGVIIGYLFLYKCQEWLDCRTITQRQTTNLTVTLYGLNPYTTYYIIVSALTSVGEGPRAQTHFRTWQDIPSGSPANISLVGATSHSLTITWTEPTPELQNGPIIRYTVRYWEEGQANMEPAAVDDLQANQSSDGGSQRFPTHEEALSSSSPAALSSPPVSVVNTSQVGPLELVSLTPSTRYAVQVSAWNSVGEGNRSQVMVIETLPSSTTSISVNLTLTASVVSNGECFSVLVSWNNTNLTTNSTSWRIVIESYVLHYTITADTVQSVSLPGTNLSYTFPPGTLKQSTNYDFFLNATVRFTNGGASSVRSAGGDVITVLTPLCSDKKLFVVVAVVGSACVLLLSAMMICCICSCSYKWWRKRRLVLEQQVESIPHSPVVLNDYVTLMNRGDGRSSVSGSPSETLSSLFPVGSTVNSGGDSAASSSTGSSRDPSPTEQSRLLSPLPTLVPAVSHTFPAPAEANSGDYISNDVFFPGIESQDLPKDLPRDNPEGCSVASSTSDTED